MPENPPPTPSSFADTARGTSRVGTAEARALLRECFTQYKARLIDMARSSLEMSTDLFEWNSQVTEGEVERFKARRGEWLERFALTIDDLYERRMAGQRRKGRRPDAESAGLNVKMLSDFDHAKQEALVNAMQHLHEYTRHEVTALDQRFAALAPERQANDIDNPFAPAYVLDAIGVTSRAIYPEPRIWRPLMERMLSDITPGVHKIYMALNRLLATHEVLPEINAALRARSALRPADDADLLPAFRELLAKAGMAGRAGADAPLPLPTGGDRNVLPAATVVAALKALAQSKPGASVDRGPRRMSTDDDAFPDLDPMLALGGTASTVALLSTLQRMDLPAEVLREAERSLGAKPNSTVPRNLVPYIREMLGPSIQHPAERTTLDVVALLFEYVSRDPSIPDALRPLLGRLQVPILKAALMDPAFFQNPRNPARHTLDLLAAATIGAADDPGYCAALQTLATELVDVIGRRFEIDLTAFQDADNRLAAFIGDESRKTADAVIPDIRRAAAAEQDESDRGRVRGLVRDRLAGMDVPAPIRSFVESTWADYLTLLRKEQGEHSVAASEALRTLEDLLWSVVAKERTGQKARLAKMIPTLVMSLRKGGKAVGLPDERAKTFLEELYQLHIAAIKQHDVVAQPAAVAPLRPTLADAVRPKPGSPSPGIAVASIHDFVSEMVAGTWLAFQSDRGTTQARLVWTGSLRMTYVFASRSGLSVYVYSPEHLADALISGKVSLVLEPVPLFDRAVSSALNALAERRSADAAERALVSDH
ncbi:MAG TPA: DUF1631 family protein [Casimicrobiaceae bacterium]